jgi:hypothetical protein
MRQQEFNEFIENKVKSSLENELWSKAIFKIEFSSDGTRASDFAYFDLKGTEKSFIYLDEKGRERAKKINQQEKILEVAEKLYKNQRENSNLRWNRLEYIIYHGSTASQVRYIWDKATNQENTYWAAKADVNWLYERLALYIAEFLTDEWGKQDQPWERASFTVDRKVDFFHIQGTVVVDGKKISVPYEPGERNQTYVPSERVQGILQRLYQQTNEGKLKERWPKWSHITLRVTHYPMEFEKDVTFEWREENV